jgi:hypothetical protein
MHHTEHDRITQAVADGKTKYESNMYVSKTHLKRLLIPGIEYRSPCPY